GITARYFDYNSDTTGDQDESGYTTDAGFIFTVASSLRIAAVGHNLLGSNATSYPRGFGTGLSFAPGGPLSISVDSLWNLELEDDQKSGRFGGGLEYLFAAQDGISRYPIRFGGVFDRASDEGYLNFGLGFSSAKLGLDIGGRKQVSGTGDEFIVQIGLSLVGAVPQARR
ncbi:MAG: hypothetical protein JKY56_06830, partial [Kofleriaceae bacterium]|nr:hypothetical protein [Kofleriaceae bacterium]